MTYLLDTNAWIHFFAEPHKLSDDARRKLGNETTLGLSTISLIEVSQKVHTGKLAFSMPVTDWFSIAIPPKRIRLIPIDPSIALEAYNFGPEFHNDPADRIITATAKVHGLRLATSDRKLLAYSGVQRLATR